MFIYFPVLFAPSKDRLLVSVKKQGTKYSYHYVILIDAFLLSSSCSQISLSLLSSPTVAIIHTLSSTYLQRLAEVCSAFFIHIVFSFYILFSYTVSPCSPEGRGW